MRDVEDAALYILHGFIVRGKRNHFILLGLRCLIMAKETLIEDNMYVCENESCPEHGIEKSGAERVCPRCGTETIIYRTRTIIKKKFLYAFIFASILLVLCILGYVYLFCIKEG